MSDNGLALDMRGVSKTFGKERVLDDVTFRVRRGALHGLVGHNGAGKSTLMKIALGGVAPTEGTVSVGDVRLTYSRPAEAREAGVGMVLQELSLIPTLTVVDNIFLNDEKIRGPRMISRGAQSHEARELLRQLGITGIRPAQTVGELSTSQQQMVEIAKAFRLSRELLILDEPTAPLARGEIAGLFKLVRRTASLGTGVVFITHHLREVFEICEEVTVLREGRTVLSIPTSATTLEEVVEALVGAELSTVESDEHERGLSDEPPILQVEDLAVKEKLDGVSFDLAPGEILGIAGLAGSGRTTLLKTLFGTIRPARGEVRLRGKRFRPKGPADAISRGVFLVPEDRRVHGVILTHTIEQNVVLSILERIARFFLYRARIGRRIVQRMIKTLDVKTTGPQQTVEELSGGNQQKVVFSKALVAEASVFLLDEPTFGVDVTTAAEVIRRVREEVDSGKAAAWVSSDLDELLHVSDRVLVLADGTIKTVVPRGAREFAEDWMLRAIQRGSTTGPSSAAAGRP
jgi:ribose transport system ATP-binding protein